MNTGRYLILFLIVALISISGNLILDNWHYKQGDHRRLQKEINKKFKRTDNIFEKLQENNWQLDTQLPIDKGIIIVAYRHDSLTYWSDNTLSFRGFDENLFAGKHFKFISNGWYVIKPYVNDFIRAYALILVKTQYPYQNDFLVNKFQPDFKLPASTELLTEAKPGSYAVVDWEGIYLFSIKFRVDELRFARLEKYLIPIFFLLAFLFLLILISQVYKQITRPWVRNTAILLLIPAFAFLRWMQYKHHFPVNFYELELFGPVPFAKSIWLPSLGEVFINTMLILFVVVQFYLGYEFSGRTATGKKQGNPATLAVMIAILIGFYVYTHFIISNLILHSTINFEFYKAATLDTYTVIGLLIIAMHFAALLLIANKLLLVCPATCKFKTLLGIFSGTSAVVFLLLHLVFY